MPQKSNKVEIRVTDLEKKDWQEAAGGTRLVSSWLRALANAECARLRTRPIDGPGRDPSIPDFTYDKNMLRERKTPLSTASAIIKCSREQYHRSGVYCGACKQVIR